MVDIFVPEDVQDIIDKLNSHGFKAYLVGGALRDELMGRPPKDYDIATNCKPEQMLEVFKDFRVIETGIKHGTITLVINERNYEVTTFRVDGNYSDNRRPDSVEFVNDIEDDLSRRDFTINAMAYNQVEGLIDPFGGYEDIQNKLVRCVGNSDERFAEDALRMLRAFRFGAELKFKVGQHTKASIKRNAKRIESVSKERITVEICKILASDCPDRIGSLYTSKLSKHFFPEFDKMFKTEQNNLWHHLSVGRHTILALKRSKKDLTLRLAVLLHDIGKPKAKTTDDNGIDHFYHHPVYSVEIANDFLVRMHFDNKTISDVLSLIAYHDVEINHKEKHIKKMLNNLGEELFFKWLDLRDADIQSQTIAWIEERLQDNDEVRKIAKDILNRKEPFSMKDLAINGTDLIGIGYKQGEKIGEVLDKLLDLVIETPACNERNALLGFAETWLLQ